MSKAIKIEVKDMNAPEQSNDRTDKKEEDVSELDVESEVQRAGDMTQEREEATEDALARKEKEAKENYDRWLRCQAEFENYKKRQERDRVEFCRYANEGIIKQLLPTLDNLERAITHSRNGNATDSLIEGVELTLNGLMDALQKQGLKRIEAVGEKFDPNFHEAVMTEENNKVEDMTVLSEVLKGYLLHDRVIRPSMVVVAKEPS
ncbi:MAG: nucleotide exchange factor GrpE [Deltaproteobacteria bacterium]|nr:nucleotide exchange factor GrpE [Deltaproteobacteria bacterium]